MFRVTARSILNCGNGMTSASWRYVRSVVKRQPVNGVPTLKGKVKTEYESKFDEDYMNVNDMKDLKKLVQQMFVNTDETQTEAEYDMEEDYDAPIEHAEKFYDVNKQEEMQHKSLVKKQIIGKKYFKEPRETNLLTHSAKMQIRHLHRLDPNEWSPEKIAECFPISVKGAKRLLKNNFEIKDEEKIKLHDADVAKKWELLESGNRESISPVTLKLYIEGEITRDHHAGNFSLSSPVGEKRIALPEDKPKKIGEHAAMIKYYLNLKKSTDSKVPSQDVVTDTSLTLSNGEIVNLSKYKQRDLQKSVLPKFNKSISPTRKELENMKCASYLATNEIDPDEIEIPQAQFEENLMQEFSEKKSKSPIDSAYESWVEKQVLQKSSDSNEKKPQAFDSKDFFEAVKKYNGDAIELQKDGSSVYLFDEQLGYQYPLGEKMIPRYINIPPKKFVRGALYRVGKNFYADDGEFLYKVYV